jgi:hypothetical protein
MTKCQILIQVVASGGRDTFATLKWVYLEDLNLHLVDFLERKGLSHSKTEDQMFDSLASYLLGRYKEPNFSRIQMSHGDRVLIEDLGWDVYGDDGWNFPLHDDMTQLKNVIKTFTLYTDSDRFQ